MPGKKSLFRLQEEKTNTKTLEIQTMRDEKRAKAKFGVASVCRQKEERNRVLTPAQLDAFTVVRSVRQESSSDSLLWHATLDE